MEGLTLSLSIQSGLRKGVTLEGKPGDQIHIGRVVKGNALSIRDPSISQKHLAVRFLPEVNSWAVTDLGSSNGTYLNGALISPDEPSPLVGGDIIQIGEKTSIVVHVSTPQAEPLPFSRYERLRRRAKPVSLEDEKVNDPQKIGGRGRTNVRKRNNDNSQSVVMEQSMVVTKASARARSTTVSEMKVLEDRVIAISDSDSAEGAEKEKPLKHNSVGAEEEKAFVGGVKETRDDEVEDDMDSMTTGEWFDRMEEYLPKKINKVAESIIAKLSDKARLFDEFIVQTSNAREMN